VNLGRFIPEISHELCELQNRNLNPLLTPNSPHYFISSPQYLLSSKIPLLTTNHLYSQLPLLTTTSLHNYLSSQRPLLTTTSPHNYLSSITTPLLTTPLLTTTSHNLKFASAL
jgi:hypothetical protein